MGRGPSWIPIPAIPQNNDGTRVSRTVAENRPAGGVFIALRRHATNGSPEGTVDGFSVTRIKYLP